MMVMSGVSIHLSTQHVYPEQGILDCMQVYPAVQASSQRLAFHTIQRDWKIRCAMMTFFSEPGENCLI